MRVGRAENSGGNWLLDCGVPFTFHSEMGILDFGAAGRALYHGMYGILSPDLHRPLFCLWFSIVLVW